MKMLIEKYNKEVVPKMMEKFGLKNKMAVPKIVKIVVNSGFGKEIVGKSGSEREKTIKNIENVISLTTGQRPNQRQAKISISSFKLREGMPIGLSVTLRGQRMYDFLGKLIHVVLPRMRDFRGIPLKSIDKKGNLSIGFKEYAPFPEVSLEKEKGNFGLETVIVTNAGNKEKGEELLRMMGIPLQVKSQKSKI